MNIAKHSMICHITSHVFTQYPYDKVETRLLNIQAHHMVNSFT